jgi:hypothetical protein
VSVVAFWVDVTANGLVVNLQSLILLLMLLLRRKRKLFGLIKNYAFGSRELIAIPPTHSKK